MLDNYTAKSLKSQRLHLKSAWKIHLSRYQCDATNLWTLRVWTDCEMIASPIHHSCFQSHILFGYSRVFSVESCLVFSNENKETPSLFRLWIRKRASYMSLMRFETFVDSSIVLLERRNDAWHFVGQSNIHIQTDIYSLDAKNSVCISNKIEKSIRNEVVFLSSQHILIREHSWLLC